MGTKNNPGKFDCYTSAEPDEPMFVLLARDPHAPGAVELWADMRELAIHRGHKPQVDMLMVQEARACAAEMRRWRSRK